MLSCASANCSLCEMKYGVKCAILEFKVHILGVSIGESYHYLPEDKILSCDRNMIFLAWPVWRNVRAVLNFRVSYEHEKTQFTEIHCSYKTIVIWSQVVTMAKSCRKFWFQSGILLIVLIACVICVCESRSTLQSQTNSTNGGRTAPTIIQVPNRVTHCPEGKKLDVNGKCRKPFK
jgi:hypothetical protein